MLRVFSAFLFLSALVQLIAAATWWYNINNMPLLHLYVAAGFFCIALFYRIVFRDFLDQRVLLVTAFAFVLFSIVNAVFFQSVFRHCSYTLTVESVLVIILSLSTFIIFLNDQVKEIVIPERKSLYWINAGLFIYYSSSLLIFYFSDIMARELPVYLNQYTWVLHSFFSTVMYTCFIIALWKRPKSLVS